MKDATLAIILLDNSNLNRNLPQGGRNLIEWKSSRLSNIGLLDSNTILIQYLSPGASLGTPAFSPHFHLDQDMKGYVKDQLIEFVEILYRSCFML